MKQNLRCLFISVIIFSTTESFCQTPPASFLEGLRAFKTDPVKAKALFYDAINADTSFYGAYNFIGILLTDEKKYDSAIYYSVTSIRLNEKNASHTKEFTIARLCRLYTYTADFEKAYQTALQATHDYPDNPNFVNELQDACSWAYNIKYGGLSKEYLAPDQQTEYKVNSVAQEYLIMRNISVKGSRLQFKGQTFNMNKNMDVLKCAVGNTEDEVALNFKLGWDISKTFGDNMPDYKKVYEDKQIPVWLRIGAIMSGTAKVDVLKEVSKLSK